MKRILKQAYTTEFKGLAVKRVTDDEAIDVVVMDWVWPTKRFAIGSRRRKRQAQRRGGARPSRRRK